MNKKRFYILVVAVLLISNTFLLAMFIMAPKGPPKHEGPKKQIIEKLHFDKNQVASFEKLIIKHGEGIVKHETKLNSAKEKLYQNLNEVNPNNDSIYKIIATEHEAIEALNYSHFEEIKALCKKDQLDDFKALTKDLVKFFSKVPPRKK